MEVSKVDLARVDNVLKALSKAKYDDLLCGEILAFAQCYHWLIEFQSRLTKALETPIPLPVESPIKKAKKK
jgi:hypothetical protein